MLTTLKIKNVALIKDLTVSFGPGLNVLSGETGAGKSILIDSLTFVAGGKADKTLLRAGADKCSVEAVFDLSEGVPAVDEALRDMEIEPEDVLILYRSLDAAGKSKCLVNGETATAAMVRRLGGLLVDIHGQSEHHSLMKVSSHIELVDKFAGSALAPLAASYGEALSRYRAVQRELKSFGGSEDERARTLDLLKYQIDEIAEAAPQEGEEEELSATRTKAMHVEKLVTALTEAAELLKRGTGASLDTTGEALSALTQVSQYDDSVEEARARLQSLRYELDDVADAVASLADSYDFDESDLERIERRLDTYRMLHKKYGASLADINAFLERASAEYDRLSSSEQEIARLKKELGKTCDALYAAACALSEARREAALRFTDSVVAELNDLGLKSAVFEVRFLPLPAREELDARITANGADEVEFYLTANLGQPVKPLVKVISGGEASRFMLAIKTITSDIDGVPLLVFDEIDTGISGEIAQMVAKKFARISRRHQLLAITHLPQIAAMGDDNLLIEKRAEAGETVTNVTRLTGGEREREIARLAGGANLGEHGVLHAREMIAWSDTFKSGLT